MRESKTSKNINKDELVENVEKRFEEELKEIKEKVNAEKLSDEFKENLEARLQEELNKTDTNNKGKVIKFPVLTRKLAGICACFVFLCSGCLAFADDIEDLVLKMFGNTDKIIENAIAEGNYREIDMEYVEDNGVLIKVDYIVFDDDNLYMAFNVRGEECDKIFFNDISIKDQDNLTLYTRDNGEKKSRLILDRSYIGKNNIVFIYKLSEIKDDFENSTNLKIKITDINCMKNGEIFNQKGSWNFDINI